MDNVLVKQNSNSEAYVKTKSSWMSFPAGSKLILLTILPLIFSQIISRIYPIVDNHYINILGTQALLIHNIQYGFISLGQYIGSGTAITCLIFWKRSIYADKQKSVFALHVGLCAIVTLFCMFLASVFAKDILSYFAVQRKYISVGVSYFRIGLFNMVLQAIYLTLMGIVVASNKEKLSLYFSIALLALNVVADTIAIHATFSGPVSPETVFYPLILIAYSAMAFLLISILIMTLIIFKRATGWGFINFKEILKIWSNELGGAFISGVYPIVYIFQLGAIKSSGSLLVTYQLLLQLTIVFCIPLLATMQISLRDASDEKNNGCLSSNPKWWQELFYFGLIPTQILLAIFILMPVMSVHLVFGYEVPPDHVAFVMLFLLASIIGQFGNALTVPIRAKKQSHLVTFSYFFSDIIIMLGGMQLIIFMHWSDPIMVGMVTLAYACAYTLLNIYFVLRK